MRYGTITRLFISIIIIAFTIGLASQITDDPLFTFILPIIYLILAIILSALIK